MKLYDCAMAPNLRRGRIFLDEKGISLPSIEVNILEEENLSPAYLAIDPRGLLPTRELDDGTRIDEVMAICRYFEAIQPQPALLGRNAKEKAIVESRQRKMEFDGMIAGSEIFRNQHEKFARRSLPGAGGETLPAIPALIERGTQTVARFFKWLEIYLGESEYVAGEVYTMADITALCAVDFLAWVKLAIPPENTLTLAWYAKASARPSAKA